MAQKEPHDLSLEAFIQAILAQPHPIFAIIRAQHNTEQGLFALMFVSLAKNSQLNNANLKALCIYKFFFTNQYGLKLNFKHTDVDNSKFNKLFNDLFDYSNLTVQYLLKEAPLQLLQKKSPEPSAEDLLEASEKDPLQSSKQDLIANIIFLFNAIFSYLYSESLKNIYRLYLEPEQPAESQASQTSSEITKDGPNPYDLYKKEIHKLKFFKTCFNQNDFEKTESDPFQAYIEAISDDLHKAGFLPEEFGVDKFEQLLLPAAKPKTNKQPTQAYDATASCLSCHII
ncbi:MAG: hypothetical protein K0S11_1823 [Gammaproteobacteria bacterium]|jgi:hypothetical protein|nr:hypothetical protein [Gammaproteobacteria bacterium]